MGTCQTIRSLRAVSICLLVLGAAGCTDFSNDELVYDNPAPSDELYIPADEGDFFLAVAVSGGGSRSAVWSAAVLEELYRQVKLPDGRSITDEIDYISSVSGGSISSAYWCLNKPEVDTTHASEYDTFFERFSADMCTNIQGEMISRPREWSRLLLTDEQKGLVLMRELDDRFYSGRTFYDLYMREKARISPTLIINGTEMDSGAKFLFTTLPRSEFTNRSLLSIVSGTTSGIMKSNIIYDPDVLRVRFCRDAGLSIGRMRVSRAVVASAGVPLLFGPVVLKDEFRSTPEREAYIHVNDGGISDTLGLETLIQLFMDRYNRPKKKRFVRGLILIIDANQHLDPEDSIFSIEGFGPAALIERSREIISYRGKNLTYLTIMFLQQDPRFKDIRFVYISPYMVDDPEIIARIKKTPTRLKIKPENAENLRAAATIVVGGIKDRILANFEGKDVNGGQPAFGGVQ
ncbi:MAG: patatin-like phospholipase family protein [Deltaproteobacteria bacterium]|nr:patatin-like phospholipase family protein [Candidatus Zymogenaceae bacterium]